MRNLFLSVLFAVLVCVGARAEESGLPVWRIEIQGGSLQGPSADYTATLQSVQPQTMAASASMRSDDSFEFRGIDFGDYWLTITDPRGATIYEGLVTARTGASQTVLYLSPQQQKPQVPGQPISVGELRHPPSRKAFAAFVDSQQFAEKGQFAAAAARLEKATRLSPDWPQAHTNLAAEYIRLRRFEDGIAEAKRAIELTKPNAIDLGNISFAEYQLNRRTDAIETARAGLIVDPQSPKLHYLLGIYLAMDRRTLPESIPHLEVAARTMEGARVNLDKARQALR